MFRSLYAHAGLHYVVDRSRIRIGRPDAGPDGRNAVYRTDEDDGRGICQCLRSVQRHLGSGGRSVDQYRNVGAAGMVLRPARNSCGHIAEPVDRSILLETLFPVPERPQRESVDICQNVCETYTTRIGGVGRHVSDSWRIAIRPDGGNRGLVDVRNHCNRFFLLTAFWGPLHCNQRNETYCE